MEKIARAGLNGNTRKKALQLACGLLIAGTVFMLRASPVFLLFYCLAAFVFASGVLSPRLIAPALAGLDNAIAFLTRLLGAAALTVFYFGILTPCGLIQRFLSVRQKKNNSYWQATSADKQGSGSFENQF